MLIGLGLEPICVFVSCFGHLFEVAKDCMSLHITYLHLVAADKELQYMYVLTNINAGWHFIYTCDL